MPNLVDDCTTIFLGKWAKLETLQKLSPYIRVLYKFLLESVKVLNRIYLNDWLLVQGFRMLNLGDEEKPFFWKCETKLQTLQNLSRYIGVCYKFVLKSGKILNRISWPMEYCFKTWECRIWSTNTKPFFWEREAKMKTLQNLFLYIGVSYEFVLKSLKGQNPILWVIEYWFKAL